MKKLLGIVVLGLLVCSNSFAHGKNLDVLEKCADGKVWTKLIEYTGADRKYAGSIIRIMGIKYDDAEKILKEANDIRFSQPDLSREAGKFINKHLTTYAINKSLKTFGASLKELTLEDLKTPDQKILTQYKEMMENIDRRYRHQEYLWQKGLIMYAKKINEIKNTDLKLKVKSGLYLEIFTECEVEYNKTPNSFLLKYK